MDAIKYLSVCSGVEAASLAWQPLGWDPVAFSEIEPFPCEVLKQRFPDDPNLGNLEKIKCLDNKEGLFEYVSSDGVVQQRSLGRVDLLVGGTPCQSFSVAGGGARKPIDVSDPITTWNYCNSRDVLVKTTDTTVENGSYVRRLLPIECERLMGFPDGWTQISWRGKPASECPDSLRYKACGNSMCVNVMRWIGMRIQNKMKGE